MSDDALLFAVAENLVARAEHRYATDPMYGKRVEVTIAALIGGGLVEFMQPGVAISVMVALLISEMSDLDVERSLDV